MAESVESTYNSMPQMKETERLQTLDNYELWDIEMQNELEGLISLASKICDTPISLVNLLDSDTQLTKASIGWNLKKMAKESSFCQYTILDDRLMIVEDAENDDRFKNSPFVKSTPNIRFYAGMPLTTSEGYRLGAICVIDNKPRQLTKKQEQSLEILADEVIARFELIRNKKRLEKRSKMELEKRSKAIEASIDGIAILDKESNFSYINKSYAAIFGYSKKRLLGSRWEMLYDKPERKHFKRTVTQQLQARKQWRGEAVGKSKGGTSLPVEVSLSKLDTGGLVCIVRDISKKIKRIQKLEKLLSEKQTILESASDCIVMIDHEGKVVQFNAAAENIFGYTAEEIKGKSLSNAIIPKKHREGHEKGMQHFLKTGEGPIMGQLIEINGLHKDGTEIPVELQVNYIKDTNPPQFMGILRDITERKRSQRELEEEKKLSEKIINSLPVDFVMLGKNGNAIRWNKNLLRNTGYNQQEIAHLHPVNYFSEEEHPIIREKIAHMFDGGQTSIEATLITKSGTKKPYIFSATRFESNDKIYVLATGQDITEQKKVQQKIKQSLKDKEVLLAEVHHRVKNNLAVISGLLQLESFQATEPSLRNTLLNSQLRIHSMATIHELLYETKNFAHLPFQKFISKVIKYIKSLHGRGNKNVCIEYQTTNIMLNINQAIPCALIINELITNAYKHAFEHTVEGKIVVSLNFSAEHHVVVLQVSDNGSGIPDNMNVTETASLGFTLINTLVEQLNGDLNITRENGTAISVIFKKENKIGSGNSLVLS